MQNTTLIIIFKILQDLIPHYIYYIYAVNKSFHQYAIREKNFSTFHVHGNVLPIKKSKTQR